MEITQLLDMSVKKSASDLHIMPNMAPLLRIDGTLTQLKELAILNPTEAKELIYSVMTREQCKHFEEKLVLEMALSVPNVGNFRVSIFHQFRGIGAVFRVIPEKVPSFEQLQLPPVLKPLLALTHGLILVSGPTGSGKSTTLAAMIDYVNTFRNCNIITIEDPIEFIHANKRSVLNQLQVGRDTTDYANALRSSLRQDPNVIMLGELRDLETMRLALTAAETGHLVMATLHASSAPITINRFADVFPSEEKNRVRTLLAETLQAVICQALVKKTAGGRTAAFEVMITTPPIRNYIRQDMPGHMESAMQTGGDKGMFTLEQYMHQLIESNIIKPLIANAVLANRTGISEETEKKK